MNKHNGLNDLTPEEQAEIRSLNAGVEPPPRMEEAVVGALRRRGLVQPDRSFFRRASGLLADHWRAAVAAALLFVAGVALGFSVGGAQTAPSEPGASEARYILILLEGNGNVVTGDPAGVVREYASWVENVRASGRWITGAPLAEGGHRLVVTDSGVQIRSPEGERVRMTGYFMFAARDEADAMKTIADCPHLSRGGIVELRRIGLS